MTAPWTGSRGTRCPKCKGGVCQESDVGGYPYPVGTTAYACALCDRRWTTVPVTYSEPPPARPTPSAGTPVAVGHKPGGITLAPVVVLHQAWRLVSDTTGSRAVCNDCGAVSRTLTELLATSCPCTPDQ